MWREEKHFHSFIHSFRNGVLRDKSKTTTRGHVWPHLREPLVHALFHQRVKILQGEAGGAEEAALPAGRLQTRHPAPDVRRIDAQQDAEGDGRHGAQGRGDVQHRGAVLPPLLGRRCLLHPPLGGSSRFRGLHLTSRAVWSQAHLARESRMYGTLSPAPNVRVRPPATLRSRPLTD